MAWNVSVDCHEESINTSGNYSTVYLKVTLSTSGSSYNRNGTTAHVWFNGQEFTNHWSLNKNSTTTIYEGRKNIGHDASGNGSCSWSYNIPIGTSAGGTKADSGLISLTHIARYFTNTPSIWLNSVTTNSAKISWSTSEDCDWISYSLNNAGWIGTGGNPFEIGGLTSNTNYTIKCNMRRKDSGLFSTSNTINFTTLKYISIKSFNITSRKLNSLSYSWSTDESCSKVQYSLNNGNWTDISGSGTSGSLTISKLQPNTSYSCKIRVLKSSNGLWTTGWNVSSSTLNINKLTSIKFGNTTTSNNGFNIYNGQSLTINCNRNSEGNIRYFIDVPLGTRRLTSDLTTDTSYTFTAEQIQSLLQYFPDSNSQSIRVGVDTYGDTTYYNYMEGTINVTNSNPIFKNFTYKDSNSVTSALTGNNQIFIDKYSNAEITISKDSKMVAQNYASPIRYSIVCGNQSQIKNYATDDIVTTISKVSTSNILVRAQDSRGNQTAVSKNIKNIVYKNVNINSITTDRIDGVSKNLTFNLSGTYTDVNFGAKSNSIKSAVIRYKEKNSSTWSDSISILGNLKQDKGNITTATNILSGYTFDLGTEYDIEVTIADELSSYTINSTLNNGHPIYSAVKNKGMAIGGIYDTSIGGTLQVNGNTSIIGNMTVNGKSLLDITYPIGAIYLSVSSTSPATLFGGTWEQIKDKFLLSAGSTYSAGTSGGSATHSIAVANLPAHTHTYSNATAVQGHTLTINEIPKHTHNLRSNYTAGGSYATPVFDFNQGHSSNDVNAVLSAGGGKSHNHGLTKATANTSSTGSGTALNTMPPYLAVYMWKRTA